MGSFGSILDRDGYVVRSGVKYPVQAAEDLLAPSHQWELLFVVEEDEQITRLTWTAHGPEFHFAHFPRVVEDPHIALERLQGQFESLRVQLINALAESGVAYDRGFHDGILGSYSK